jgi:Zn finger protein HypA/HybF involved in hydrogenase expression
MNFRSNAECSNCFEVYKADDFVTCPNCDAEPIEGANK